MPRFTSGLLAAATVLATLAVPAPVVAAEPALRVLVVLADQHLDVSAGRASGRAAALAADQAPVLDTLRDKGAHEMRPYQLINAVATALPASSVRALSADPRVSAVLPDTPIRVAPPARQRTGPVGPTEPAAGGGVGCTTTPVVEPEGLTLTGTVGVGSRPGAHDLADGGGVRVGVLGGPIDPAAPEFQRDGRSVIGGYADFTGQGLAAPSFILESFGDASVIAAQGNTVYDGGRYAHAAHRPPAPCPMRILGVAPGATVHVANVFGGVAAPTSVILAGLEWAVLDQRVDVLNESLVTYGYPDTAQNALRLANDAAVAAGVTVVVASGDAGPDGTLGSPASDPDVLAVGASTQLRDYTRLGYGGAPLGAGYRSDGLSALSSGGLAQSEPRMVDLVAPGDTAFAACSPDTAHYVSCISFFDGAFTPSPFFFFGGTSAAAPFAAGAAALVIQAYRRQHGHSPSPAMVKQILTSSAADLGGSPAEQGAGRIDVLRAVRTASGAGGLVVEEPAVRFTAATGTRGRVAVTVTNTAAKPHTVGVGFRPPGGDRPLAAGELALTPSNAQPFTDVDGLPAYAKRIPLDVPRGSDELKVAVGWRPDPHGSPVAVSLFDPAGRLAAYSLPLGDGGFGRAAVSRPEPGRWSAAIWTRDDGTPPVGTVRYEATTAVRAAKPVDTLTIPPGASRRVHVGVRTPDEPGDTAAAIVLTDRTSDQVTTVPVGLRALVGAGGAFAGTLTGGNGVLAGAAAIGQYRSFQFDVPRGRRDVGVSVRAGDDPGYEVWGFLIDPDGMPVAVSSSRASGGPPAVQLTRRDPVAGRWTVVLLLVAPASTGRTSQPFQGKVTFDGVRARVAGLPAGSDLPAGRPVTATVTVTNTGATRAPFFASARLDEIGPIPLRSVNPSRYDTPVSGLDVYPRYPVPPGTVRLDIVAESERELAIDTQPFAAGGYYVGDPDVAGIPGRNAVATVTASPRGAGVAATTWVCNANPAGPFGDAPTLAPVSCAATAYTRLFDRSAATSTGDYWLSTVDPTARPYEPHWLSPGQTGQITVTLTPTTPGERTSGIVTVSTVDPVTGFGTELAAFPYRYRVR